jgi:hypothetical protein
MNQKIENLEHLSTAKHGRNSILYHYGTGPGVAVGVATGLTAPWAKTLFGKFTVMTIRATRAARTTSRSEMPLSCSSVPEEF